MATEEDVRRICLSLNGATEQMYAGLPGFRVKRELFARIRERPDALVVMTPAIEVKEAMIAADPDKFFQTDHYAGHEAVLVRLEAVSVEELEELLIESWLLRAPKRLIAAYYASLQPEP